MPPQGFFGSKATETSILESSSSNFASDADSAPIVRTNLPPSNELRSFPRAVAVVHARPLWLSTTGYFLIAGAVSLSLFLVIWGLLHDEAEGDAPWISAGIAAALMMSLAIAIREVVLRRAQTRYLLLHEKSAAAISQRVKTKSEKKFTLEQNAAALRLIQNKVDAANSILATTENHLEVFQASQEYLALIESELQKVQVGSPRLPAFRNGQESVKILHKHHLLRWASEKTHRILREAADSISADKKIETAYGAAEALEFALKFYPNELQLINSKIAVHEFMTLVRVTHWTDLAERAAFKKQHRRAIDYYQDALFYLSRKAIDSEESNLVAAKIEREIECLNLMLSNKKPARRKLPRKNR